MQKPQETSNKILESRDFEILKLKSELQEIVEETIPTDLKLTAQVENLMVEAEIYSEKRLTDILKALESNNCKLLQDVAA